jgi:hypothetical protein
MKTEEELKAWAREMVGRMTEEDREEFRRLMGRKSPKEIRLDQLRKMLEETSDPEEREEIEERIEIVMHAL